MVVLHPTIDPEKTILDSNNVIKRENLYAVDCLFSDSELLECEKNLNAINKIAQDSKSEVGLLITMPFTQIVMMCFHRY